MKLVHLLFVCTEALKRAQVAELLMVLCSQSEMKYSYSVSCLTTCMYVYITAYLLDDHCYVYYTN